MMSVTSVPQCSSRDRNYGIVDKLCGGVSMQAESLQHSGENRHVPVRAFQVTFEYTYRHTGNVSSAED